VDVVVPEKSHKVLMMMMMVAKIGWAGEVENSWSPLYH
jgi:hypothetical protein